MKLKETSARTQRETRPSAGTAGVRFFSFGILVILVAFLVPFHVTAQDRGIVYGEMRDAETGETLAGANVIVQGTQIGTTTDEDGRYTLRRAPAGEQIIEYRYLGFHSQDIEVTVIAGERVQQNVDLEPQMIEGDEVLVRARQRGTSRTLTRQRESTNIRSVISSEHMDDFGVQTVSGALGTIAGMHGGTNIRGIGAANTNVTMDGQRMGGTGAGDRSVDVGTISADMVQDLEVIKVITPDMDANALSGVININTRRPVGGERDINARIGGGFDTKFLPITGPERRVSFSYGDSPTDRFSFAVNLSYLRTISTDERFSLNWDTRNFTFIDGSSDVLSDFTTRMEYGTRDRYGAGLQFTFQPTDRSTYHIRGMFNRQNRTDDRQGRNLEISTDRYVHPGQTGEPGFPGNKDRIEYQTRTEDRAIDQYTFQFGGRHLYDVLEMDYAMGWSHGRQNRERYDFPFRTPQRFDYLIDIEDRWHPTVDIAPHGEVTDWPSMSLPGQSGIGYRWGSYVDNEFRGTVDFQVPVPGGYGSMKFGTSALLSFKQGEYEEFGGGFDAGLSIEDMELLVNQDWKIFGRDHPSYHLPYLIDLAKAREFYHGQRPHFRVDHDSWATSSETSDYLSEEHVFAAYGMTELERGRWTFLGGVRVEHTRTRYSGKEVEIDSEGNLRAVDDVIHPNNYTHLFPNAQVIYGIGEFTNIRLAYSRSIGRPGYSQLSPTIERDYDSQTISEGNPNLNPMVSDNFDFLIDHYFLDVGQFSVGLFYKDLRDFVFSFSDKYEDAIGEVDPDAEIEDSPYVGWDYDSYLNGEEAMVYGLEVTWQQSLSFLPGPLHNFRIYSTYSYTYSEADIGRRDPSGKIMVRMEGQRPHSWNAGLNYAQGGFSGQVSYSGFTPYVTSYGDLRPVPGDPNVPIGERRFFDSYRDASNDLSFTMRYRITDAFRVWLNGNNLLFNRRVDYNYDRDLYPSSMRMSNRSFEMGIRYSI